LQRRLGAALSLVQLDAKTLADVALTTWMTDAGLV
jgi:hypothetical protein